MSYVTLSPGSLLLVATPGTDIASDLLAAWNALKRASTDYGGEILIPPGQYRCSAVTFPAFYYGECRVRIRGIQKSTIIYPYGTGWTGQAMWTFLGGQCSLRDLELSNPDHVNAMGVLLVGPSQTTDCGPYFGFEDCRLTNWSTAIRNENFGNSNITRNQFLSNDKNIHFYNGGMGATIDGNTMQGGRGIIFENHGWASEGRAIINNGMVLMDTGIEIYNGLAYQIIGNNIDANVNECIKIVGTPTSVAERINIVGAWLSGSGTHGLTVSGYARNVSLTDVDLMGHSGAAIGLYGASGDVRSVSITNCRGMNNQADVWNDAATDVHIYGCRLDSSTGYAESGSGLTTGTVRDCYIPTIGWHSANMIFSGNKP